MEAHYQVEGCEAVVVDKRLHYRPIDLHPVTPTPALVNAFARLVTFPPEAVARFAEQWGVPNPTRPRREPDGWRSVPIAPIHEYSKQVRGILHAAHAITEPTALALVGIDVLIKEFFGPHFPPPESSGIDARVQYTRDAVMSLAGSWVDDRVKDNVRHSLVWQERPTEVVTLYGVCTATAWQLSRSLTEDHLTTCSECEVPYFANRKPVDSLRNYCDACRQAGIPHRDAERDRRARIA